VKDTATSRLADLVRAEGQGPAAVRAALAEQMAMAGCAVETLAYLPGEVPMVDEFAHASVAADAGETVTIGRLAAAGAGGGGGRSLLLFAHPDTEPHQPDPGWRSAPFEPTERNGRLHGWGVADDLAGCAMLSAALLELRAAGLRPAGDVTLVAAPSKRHRRGIGAALHAGLRADAALYLHPAESGRGLGEIKAFAPGQLEFALTVEGVPPETAEPAHTAFAHRGVNPIGKAMAIVAALDALDRARGERIHHPRLETAIGRSTNLMVTHIAAGEAEVTTRLPRTCRLRAAVSLVPDEKLDAVMGEIEAAVARAASADPWLAGHPPRIDWLAGVSAAETADTDPFFRTVAGAIEAAGTTPGVNPLHTSSDIRNPIVQAGIPTLGIGPLCGGLTMAGGVDEWVDLADYRRSVAVVAAIIADWCGTLRA
jgi:acetylornithine deacetylase/succinyl-diaminopimelate desuccinylase-like protein